MDRIHALWLTLVGVACAFACTSGNDRSEHRTDLDQESLTNTVMRERTMLPDMYADAYFPRHLVDRCKGILVEMCHEIEKQRPADLDGLYAITHRATERLNGMQAAFEESESEIETGARGSFGAEFYFIAKTYGYEADMEELIAPREW
jgi:hypothetical protein